MEGLVLGEDDGVAAGVGDAVGDGEGVADVPVPGVSPGDAEGVAFSALIGLESKITPQTLQVLCILPIYFVVGSSTVTQSVATWPGAGILSV